MDLREFVYVASAVVVGSFIYDKVKPKLQEAGYLFGLGETIDRTANPHYKIKMGPFGPEYYSNVV